ncbi:MAG: chemotaxis protein CheW [bacterium]
MENQTDTIYAKHNRNFVTDKILSSEEKNAILRERTKLLMIKPKKEDISTEKLEVLEFSISDERYAIDVDNIIEVISLKEITHLPCTPNFILGIINVRGKIIAVISLKKFLNLPEKGNGDNKKIIIVKHRDIELGIMSDEIMGSREILLNKLQGEVTTVSGILNDYIMGVTEERLIVLNIKALLENEKITINEEV